MENKEIDILLIEDNENDAELAMRALQKNNVARNIIHLIDGEHALDFLFGQGQYTGRNTDNKPRVILLDLKMPKISGLEVLEQIKSSELTQKIPVVMLTSSKEHPDVEKAYALGANSYIVKPVDFDNFRQVVTDLGIYWLLLSQPSS
jgi:two-component system, response regulator